MLDLNENERILNVVPKPDASMYLYYYNTDHLKAKIITNKKDIPLWVTFYTQNKKIWFCDVPYFLKNFDRFPGN